MIVIEIEFDVKEIPVITIIVVIIIVIIIITIIIFEKIYGGYMVSRSCFDQGDFPCSI